MLPQQQYNLLNKNTLNFSTYNNNNNKNNNNNNNNNNNFIIVFTYNSNTSSVTPFFVVE